MAGYYQQSGTPGWGTNQAILFNLIPPFCLTFSFSFSSELRPSQTFSLNPVVSILDSEDYQLRLLTCSP